jgi:hypothetical protein
MHLAEPSASNILQSLHKRASGQLAFYLYIAKIRPVAENILADSLFSISPQNGICVKRFIGDEKGIM